MATGSKGLCTLRGMSDSGGSWAETDVSVKPLCLRVSGDTCMRKGKLKKDKSGGSRETRMRALH